MYMKLVINAPELDVNVDFELDISESEALTMLDKFAQTGIEALAAMEQSDSASSEISLIQDPEPTINYEILSDMINKIRQTLDDDDEQGDPYVSSADQHISSSREEVWDTNMDIQKPYWEA